MKFIVVRVKIKETKGNGNRIDFAHVIITLKNINYVLTIPELRRRQVYCSQNISKPRWTCREQHNNDKISGTFPNDKVDMDMLPRRIS